MTLVQAEQRRNLATNPSFEVNTAGWAGVSSSTIARSTTRAKAGSASGLITLGAGAAVTQGANTTVTGLTVGAEYTASVDLYVPAASVAANLALFVAGTAVISPAVTTGDSWVRTACTFTATATSHTIAVSNGAASTAGMTAYVDALLVERTDLALPYFDGATPDVGDTSTAGSTMYAWTGTAHASASTQSQVQSSITLTAVPEPGAATPRVRIDIADSAGSPVTAVVLSRLDADGRYRQVRTSDGGPLPVSGGVATVYDYEAPFGTQVTYSTDQVDGPTAATVLDVAGVWLIHPGVPSRSVPILVSSQDDESRPVVQGVFRVLEREDPIVITGGVRSTPASALGVRTHTAEERRALDLLLGDASPLLLNIPPALDWGVDTCYIAVGDVQRGRTVRWGPHPYREWKLPYQVVGRPGGGTQAGIAWDDIATRGADDYTAAAGSQYMTWQDIVDAGVTSWAELAAPTT